MYTLHSTFQHGAAIARALTTRPGQRMEPSSETFVTPYHLAQITSPENRANPAPGDPAPSLNGDARLAVAFAREPLALTCGCGAEFFGELDTPCPSCGLIRDGEATYPASRGGDEESVVAYQCHGSNVGEMGVLRSGNGAVTGGVPFLAHALTASHDASEDGTGRGTPLVPVLAQSITASHAKGSATAGNSPGVVNPIMSPAGVRRLSPVECERLQGWPDQFTRFDEKGREIADGPRYKMIGNGVTASVAEWLGRRLAKAIGGAP